ncbi:hypothetical protein RhiLY_01236 [Ceratobasidium sp. AG-Ba]|nr:hypothetical protein RhiLY_01236 [Ceratobasidium sp. AG-Ba]
MANDDDVRVGLVTEGYYRYGLLSLMQPLGILINEQVYRYRIRMTCRLNYIRWRVTDNLSDRSALKAFLHTDALISEECPWHPGKRGVELYMGTIHNGESRLLFSLKQISYLSYWLHAMKLTDEPLPIPTPYYLLTPSDLRGPPSPVTYNTIAELRNALKDVGKHNKRVKTFAGDIALGEMRTVFERVRTVWGEKCGVWIAIDFEGWERDHTMITEFGWSLIRWEEKEDVKEGEDKFEEIREEGHWTVKEYAAYRNGTFVADNRNRYDFGKTEALSKETFKKRIGDMINQYATQGPLYLVFHDRYGDVKYLQQLQVPGISNIAAVPSKPPGPGMYCIDTRDMFAALEGSSSQQRSLERVCGLLKIRGFDHPHNAGNDAHFTLEILREMASGQPVDLQREARWPNQTEVLFGQQRGVKGKFSVLSMVDRLILTGRAGTVEWTEQDMDSDWEDY